jgi:hypothetical protein
MKTGPRFPTFATARQRIVRMLLPLALGVRRVSTGRLERTVEPTRQPAARIRPMQFIGVVPADVAQEKAR